MPQLVPSTLSDVNTIPHFEQKLLIYLTKGSGYEDSCEGHCGGGAPTGCYCDDKCQNYGDCCGDKAAFCGDEPGSGDYTMSTTTYSPFEPEPSHQSNIPDFSQIFKTFCDELSNKIINNPEFPHMGNPGPYQMSYPEPYQMSYPETYQMSYPETSDMGYSGTYHMSYPETSDMGYSGTYHMSYPETSDMGYSGTYHMSYPETSDMGYSGTYHMSYPETSDMGYPETSDMGYPETSDMGYPEMNNQGK